MSTLKGLFEPKPRSQRNFRLENKRDVKAKSTLNREKNNISNSAAQNSRTSVRPLPTQSATQQRPIFSGYKNNPKPILLSNRAKSCTKMPDHLSPECKGRNLSTGIESAKRAHYIQEENIPFQWTEVCPSLISHNICHQSVQTEENRIGNVANTLKFSKSEEIADCSHGDSPSSNTTNSTSRNSQPTCNISHSYVGFPKAPLANTESVNSNGEELEAESKIISSLEGENIKDIKMKHKDKKHVIKEDSLCLINSDKDSLNHLSNGISTCMISDLKPTDSRKLTSTTKISPHTHSYPTSYQKGEIPKYLSKRKAEQALASARSKEIDPNCPPGHVAMSDNERRETLDMILKNYNELIIELNKLPVRTDTLKMKQRKIEIEKQLDKLEEGIRIFSRSKVYVKVDA